MDNAMEVPQHFICPISLHIMQDPVTVASGITYDRHAIERWLSSAAICPVTKIPLSASLTPNHTLRRLIHSWCALHTPAPILLSRFHVINLIQGLSLPESRLHALRELEAAALYDDRNKVYMVEAELATKLLCFVAACWREVATEGLKEALSILYIIRTNLSQVGVLPVNDETVDSLMWVLDCDDFRDVETVRSHAAHALKAVVRRAARGPGILERLRPEFFRMAARNLRGGGGSSTEALLQVLLEACSRGRNRSMMVECGTVFDLVEVELRWWPEKEKKKKKKTTELVLGVMYQLCLCAEGRAQLLSHAAGIAVVTRRILEVSAAADERAVLIMWQIAKYAATRGVVEEMLRVGTVANLCLVMVADSGWYVKEKVRKILRMHFDAWKDSPCIQMETLTRYTR